MMMRLIALVTLLMALTACADNATPTPAPTSTPPPTATPIPLAESIRTTRPDLGELTIAYPAEWVATEVQGGQVEIASSNAALMLMVSPETTLGPGDVVGQVSLFTDAETINNTTLDALGDPSDTLLAIVGAFNFDNVLAADAEATTNDTVTSVQGSISIDEATTRTIRFYLVPVNDGAVFAYFTTEDEIGLRLLDDVVDDMLRTVVVVTDAP